MTLQASLALLATLSVVVRALCVAAEAALIGVSAERAEELHGSAPGLRTRSLLALKRDVEAAFAATRVGSILGLAIGAACAAAAALLRLGAGAPPWAIATAAGAGGVGAALAFSIVDLLPRSLAIAHPDAWALRIALPLRLGAAWVGPPARLLRTLTDRLLTPFGARATFKAAAPALEDIERILLAEAREEDDGPAPRLLHSIFEFPGRIAREVMVPRTDVVTVPLDVEPAALVRLLAEEGHSRYPVHDGAIDRIVGVLHTRDIVPLLVHPELIKVSDAIRPPVFVAWAMKIGRLLEQMQRDRIHMAMVVDEHGGFMGIVTLEDILEQIVGDIEEDDAAPPDPVVELDDEGNHTVLAAIGIERFNGIFGADLPAHEDFGTLAGFLNHLAGEIPEAGATLQSHGFSFTVLERNPTRVIRVRVEAPALRARIA
ncbi:MAG TPA: hemolysin family protein [Vulgatibacter sp.]|nr:hemolysin family protein [Vulgatibacter sp.]